MKRFKKGSGSNTDAARRRDSDQSAKLLANILRDGRTLFHLDISYNGFNRDDCALLSDGLANNTTLFGI